MSHNLIQAGFLVKYLNLFFLFVNFCN